MFGLTQGYFAECVKDLNLPKEWENIYNIKYQKEIEIRKKIPNTSPVLFQSQSLIQSHSKFTNVSDVDRDSTTYRRSYVTVSSSHMETYGGKVGKIELSYNEVMK